MASLIERMRSARETWFEVGGLSFCIRRPTLYQLSEWRLLAGDEFLRRCVVNWRAVREQDLVRGGSDSVVPFDSDLFLEFVQDRPEVMTGLAEEVRRLITAHADAAETAEKN